jgi:hypothetical protein
MKPSAEELMALEKRFWQSLADADTDATLRLLDEPALMVSEHGAMQFDHTGYRQIAEHGELVIRAFELSDMQVMFPRDDTAVLIYRVRQSLSRRGESRQFEQQMTDSSVWMLKGGQWRCVVHTETPTFDSRH